MSRDMRQSARLIIFGGLPGTGKTTLARKLANDLGATYLRIDTIERALRGSHVGPARYVKGAVGTLLI